MPYESSLLRDDRVIDVRFAGDVAIAERHAVMQLIVRAHDETGYTRLLLDFSTARVQEGTHEELRQYAEHLAREPLIHKMTIAYVGSTEQTANVEGMAALHGYFYQRFSTRDLALRWLQ